MKRKALGRDFGLTVRMAIALALLVLLNLAIAAGMFGLYRLVPSWWPYWIALAVTLAGALSAHYGNAETVLVRSIGAEVVPAGRHVAVHEALERLAELADLPPPKLVVARTSAPNAFTAGLTPKRSLVVVSTGLLDRLNRRELEAVLAHELSHVANRDCAVMTAVSLPRTAGTLLVAGSDWSVIVGAIVWPLGLPFVALGTLLTLTVSRYREYAADRGSAILTGAPEHLMSALRALSDEDGVAPGDLRDFAALEALCTVGRRQRLELLMDHPPLEKRLAQLAELARELGKPA